MVKHFDLLKVDQPSRGGRIYPREIVEQVMDRINNDEIMVTLDSSDTLTVDFARLVGWVRNARIENDELVAEVEIHNTPSGTIVKTLLENELDLTLCTAGTGNVSKEYVVSDYRLAYCFISTALDSKS